VIQEAEIKRIVVQKQPRAHSSRDPISIKPTIPEKGKGENRDEFNCGIFDIL
jgi:hypothetical protein